VRYGARRGRIALHQEGKRGDLIFPFERGGGEGRGIGFSNFVRRLYSPRGKRREGDALLPMQGGKGEGKGFPGFNSGLSFYPSGGGEKKGRELFLEKKRKTASYFL